MLTLITGASAGLGAEMARQFAAMGHDLVLTARRVERLEALRDEILAAHPTRRVEVAELDVLDDEAVLRVFARYSPLDRVIVNAGLGSSEPLGTGHHDRNRAVAMTNFVAAITQIDAAMTQFRAQRRGHLVVISSMASVRGLRGSPAVYGATKRGIAHLAEGLRSESLGTDIDVSTICPGYIRSEMTADIAGAPFTVDTQTGVRAMVDAIERRRSTAYVPRVPWMAVALLLRASPLRLVAKLTPPPRG